MGMTEFGATASLAHCESSGAVVVKVGCGTRYEEVSRLG